MTSRAGFRGAIEGRHVLFGLVAFFGVMLIANAILLYLAVSTFSGGDVSNAYQKGLNYNEIVAAAKRQDERGWRSELAYENQTRRLTLQIVDKFSAPITGLQVDARLGRPATDKEDRQVELNETGAGVYAATVDLGPGQWVISVASAWEREGGNSAYRVKQRLTVPGEP
jgi:nitrogen fixation protein FixH